MKLSDFIILSEEEKKFAVLHNGVLVAKKTSLTHFFFLFQMDHFYVETCFDIKSKDIESYKMFHHLTLLEPYLESIAIDDLLNWNKCLSVISPFFQKEKKEEIETWLRFYFLFDLCTNAWGLTVHAMYGAFTLFTICRQWKKQLLHLQSFPQLLHLTEIIFR